MLGKTDDQKHFQALQIYGLKISHAEEHTKYMLEIWD
jgi:hypothetical protein